MKKISNHRDKLEVLEQRIVELEAKQRLIKYVLSGLPEEINLEFGNFALFALLAGFSEVEISETEKLISWAIRNIDKLTREEFLDRFKQCLPNRLKELDGIMNACKKDGMAPKLWSLILREVGEQ